MHIKALTATLDQKLRELDDQLVALNRAQSQAEPGDAERFSADLLALQSVRQKLVKSRELALEAHQLERDTNEQVRQRQKYIGLSLCILSLAGLAWLGLLIYRELFTAI